MKIVFVWLGESTKLSHVAKKQSMHKNALLGVHLSIFRIFEMFRVLLIWTLYAVIDISASPLKREWDSFVTTIYGKTSLMNGV